MLRKDFVNRRNELSSLENSYEREGFEFVAVTGRRRIGKTRLLEEFARDKRAVFLRCEDRKWRYNLDKLNRIIGEFFDIPPPGFGSFRDCFDYIVKRDENVVIIIDEFSYLVKNNEILGEFQGIVDGILKDKNTDLILSGSAVSMMKKRVLGKSSPLYGRTTAQLNLRPLAFSDLMEWFDGTRIEDIVRIFGVCDAIPKYLEFFRGEDVNQEIIQNLFSPDAFLFREPKLLLEEELREPETYYQLLEAISLGHTRTTDIANHCYMEAKDISSYLSILMDLGFVEKEKSILSRKKKRGLYRIRDNFFNFWFRFVSPYFVEIESWHAEGAVEEFERFFDQYLGQIFERVCIQFLNSGTEYNRSGRWWHRGDEIDLVALNESENKILFGECKWSKNKVGIKLLDSLKEKSERVRWKNRKRIEEYALFSRAGFTRELKEEENKNLRLYTLEDIREQLSLRTGHR